MAGYSVRMPSSAALASARYDKPGLDARRLLRLNLLVANTPVAA